MLTVFPPVGDAADYASLVTHGVFDVRASHVGYYVAAWPFVTVAGWAGVPPTLALNALAALCMAGAIAAAYLVMRELGLSRRAAMLGAAALGSSGLYWYHALFGELQALLVLLVFASFWLFLAGRPVAAGVLFGASLLVSQAAAPSAVAFPLLALRRGGWRAFARCTAAGTAAFALGVLPVAREYFFGTRGVMPSLDYYQAASPVKTVLLFGYRALENHLLWLAFAAIGAVWAWRFDRRLLVLVGALWAAHAWVSLRLGHIEYGFSWMPVYLGSAALAGAGAAWTLERWGPRGAGAVAAAALASLVLMWSWYVQPKRRDAVTFAAVVDSLGALAGRDTVIAWPHEGFVYVNRRFPDVPDVWTATWQQAPVVASDWANVASADQAKWVLIHDVPTHALRRWLFANPLARRLLSAEARANYASESSSEADEMLDQLPGGRPPVFAAWPDARVYRVAPRAAAEPPPASR